MRPIRSKACASRPEATPRQITRTRGSDFTKKTHLRFRQPTRLLPIRLTLFPAEQLALQVTSTYVRQTGRLQVGVGFDSFDVNQRFWITDIGAPAGGNSDALDGRPSLPYTQGAPFDHFNRISSDSADATQFAFAVQDYTFYKTIRFNPREEANINSTYTLKRAAEIGIKPTRGDIVDANSANIVAIQFGGIGGNFKIYRK